jgi:hypothetical protein
MQWSGSQEDSVGFATGLLQDGEINIGLFVSTKFIVVGEVPREEQPGLSASLRGDGQLGVEAEVGS